MPANYPRITIGELKSLLASYPDNHTIDFSGLTFYRLKRRSDTHVQLEFGESVSRTEEGIVEVDNHG